MARFHRIVLPLALLAVTSAATASADRVALVIGNSSYQHTTSLTNPVNDARDIAAALRTAGFAVEPVLEDASKASLEAALAAFADKAHGARQALIYYAGHGIEAAGENYLVPIDAHLRNERTVNLEAVRLSDVMAVVSSAGQLGLVVLDACRDNPLAARMTRIDLTRSATRGLGPPGEPGGNLMVVYAAEAGRVAADGGGRNSPFTQAVLGALAGPPMEVRQFWGHVRDQVFRSTSGGQRPFTYGSLGGEAIYLAGSGISITPPTPVAGASTGTLVLERLNPADAQVWLDGALLPQGVREVPGLTPGQKKLQASRNGYRDRELNLFIVAGQRTRAELSLSQVPTSAPPPAPLSEQASASLAPAQYESAFNALKNGQYVDSVRQFQDFVRQYPDHTLAANAMYWLGESYFITRDYEAALSTYRECIERFPESSKGPDAELKVGLSLSELGQYAEARDALETVVSRYPNTTEARLAQGRLRTIAREVNQR